MQRLMATAEELDDAFDTGVTSAITAMDSSVQPILLVDEFCDDEISVAEEKGWNSVSASDENRRRWAEQSARI